MSLVSKSKMKDEYNMEGRTSFGFFSGRGASMVHLKNKISRLKKEKTTV